MFDIQLSMISKSKQSSSINAILCSENSKVNLCSQLNLLTVRSVGLIESSKLPARVFCSV